MPKTGLVGEDRRRNNEEKSEQQKATARTAVAEYKKAKTPEKSVAAYDAVEGSSRLDRVLFGDMRNAQTTDSNNKPVKNKVTNRN